MQYICSVDKFKRLFCKQFYTTEENAVVQRGAPPIHILKSLNVTIDATKYYHQIKYNMTDHRATQNQKKNKIQTSMHICIPGTLHIKANIKLPYRTETFHDRLELFFTCTLYQRAIILFINNTSGI